MHSTVACCEYLERWAGIKEWRKKYRNTLSPKIYANMKIMLEAVVIGATDDKGVTNKVYAFIFFGENSENLHYILMNDSLNHDKWFLKVNIRIMYIRSFLLIRNVSYILIIMYI